jgi:hypothetical protein
MLQSGSKEVLQGEGSEEKGDGYVQELNHDINTVASDGPKDITTRNV